MDPMGPILVEDLTQAAPGQHGLGTWTKEDPSQKLPKHQPTPEANNLTVKALDKGPNNQWYMGWNGAPVSMGWQQTQGFKPFLRPFVVGISLRCISYEPIYQW